MKHPSVVRFSLALATALLAMLGFTACRYQVVEYGTPNPYYLDTLDQAADSADNQQLQQ
ncbi:MAG: hypothetical protein II551_04655 [Paludibacteraceae bacterium]|jgi:hypothetical protein|nr:hypothetical protein [Paludibacteraceae bacterium]